MQEYHANPKQISSLLPRERRVEARGHASMPLLHAEVAHVLKMHIKYPSSVGPDQVFPTTLPHGPRFRMSITDGRFCADNEALGKKANHPGPRKIST